MKRRTVLTVLITLLLGLYTATLCSTPASASIEPDIRIWKEFMDTSDPPPYELRTEYHWDIEIGVSTNVDLTRATVSDRFGAELKIDSIRIPGTTYTFTYPDYANTYPTKDATVTISGEGTYDLDRGGATFGAKPYEFHIYWSGKSHKIHLEWRIGSLEAGETISIIVRVSTDLNPGGQPEFTSPCEHCLNSGAVLSARWGRNRISRGTPQLCIKVQCPAQLIVDKFNDTNRNGVYDAGDVKIANWQIDVTDPYGVTTTYLTPKTLEITELGTYIITEDLPFPWEQTAVRVDGVYMSPPTLTVAVSIASGESHDVLYGNMLPPPVPAKLTLDKFNDTNRNGVYDAGDVKIADWQIDVTDPYGVMNTYLTPEALEITDFGTYIITEHLSAPWEQTAVRVDGVYIDPPTLTVTVVINAGESHDVLYGNTLPPPPRAELILDKFNDTNRNGVYDIGVDVKIADWQIDVTDPYGVTATYLTPKTLEITDFGTYIITEHLSAPWEQTAVRVDGVYQTPPTLTVTVNINPSESHDVLYGNKLPRPPPPPVGISLHINPISVTVGRPVTFDWTINSPPEITPNYAELYLKAPDGTTIPLATYTSFPPWAGSRVWTSTTPIGTWKVYMDYHYTYLGKGYTVKAYASFYVHT